MSDKQKLDEMDEKLDTHAILLAKIEKSLDHHIYRTELLEKAVEALKTALIPVQKHVTMVNILLKAVGVVATSILMVLQILKHFNL